MAESFWVLVQVTVNIKQAKLHGARGLAELVIPATGL
jgi:hypothetical protein